MKLARLYLCLLALEWMLSVTLAMARAAVQP